MKLIFQTPDDGTLRFEVAKRAVLVGRGSACDVQIKLEGVSRQHCLIELSEDGEFFVTDLNSSNGVLIDNQRLMPGKKTAYKTFQPLAIGPLAPVTIEHEDHSRIAAIPEDSPREGGPRPTHTSPKKKDHTLADNLPGLELDVRDKSAGHFKSPLAQRKASVAAARRVPVKAKKKADRSWINITLMLLLVGALTYFLFLQENI